MAAVRPPIWMRKCALAMRRSSPAACTAAAVSTVSQNACTETRGAALAGAVFLQDGRAPHRGHVAPSLGARLHQIGGILDHGGEVALRRAAVIPRRLIFIVVA